MFITDRLAQQRQASPRTIAGYRDALKLLLEFIHARTGKLPSQLDWEDLDATMISGFLMHLEITRGNSVRTRNVRLTAIRSLISYAALRHPEHGLLIQRVLAIPPKRFDKRIVTFLTPPEIGALVAAPDQSRWEGRRDSSSDIPARAGGFLGRLASVPPKLRVLLPRSKPSAQPKWPFQDYISSRSMRRWRRCGPAWRTWRAHPW
ncbi:tyrosine-type recombinase/integrase [Pseudarthrobacter cellobiosi]|uniref:tyrosine-type recombinase/integrase n=1 Tax=Pseudarthrobacter cellobiosi TaxID=2953654 RepID=UPI0035AC044A